MNVSHIWDMIEFSVQAKQISMQVKFTHQMLSWHVVVPHYSEELYTIFYFITNLIFMLSMQNKIKRSCKNKE